MKKLLLVCLMLCLLLSSVYAYETKGEAFAWALGATAGFGVSTAFAIKNIALASDFNEVYPDAENPFTGRAVLWTLSWCLFAIILVPSWDDAFEALEVASLPPNKSLVNVSNNSFDIVIPTITFDPLQDVVTVPLVHVRL